MTDRDYSMALFLHRDEERKTRFQISEQLAYKPVVFAGLAFDDERITSRRLEDAFRLEHVEAERGRQPAGVELLRKLGDLVNQQFAMLWKALAVMAQDRPARDMGAYGDIGVLRH